MNAIPLTTDTLQSVLQFLPDNEIVTELARTGKTILQQVENVRRSNEYWKPKALALLKYPVEVDGYVDWKQVHQLLSNKDKNKLLWDEQDNREAYVVGMLFPSNSMIKWFERWSAEFATYSYDFIAGVVAADSIEKYNAMMDMFRRLDEDDALGLYHDVEQAIMSGNGMNLFNLIISGILTREVATGIPTIDNLLAYAATSKNLAHFVTLYSYSDELDVERKQTIVSNTILYTPSNAWYYASIMPEVFRQELKRRSRGILVDPFSIAYATEEREAMLDLVKLIVYNMSDEELEECLQSGLEDVDESTAATIKIVVSDPR